MDGADRVALLARSGRRGVGAAEVLRGRGLKSARPQQDAHVEAHLVRQESTWPNPVPGDRAESRQRTAGAKGRTEFPQCHKRAGGDCALKSLALEPLGELAGP